MEKVCLEIPVSAVERRVLDNGVTVVVDRDARFRSAAYSLCLCGGLRDESHKTAGITHVLEHLLLKRTQQKSARDIACLIDDLGCDVNAFTDADSLCLHGVVPAINLFELMEFFSELVFENCLDERDLEVEKEVIRQEIIEATDDPSDATYQKFSECFWSDSLLGLPVFGSQETLAHISCCALQSRLKELLFGRRVIIAACGNVDTEQLVSHAQKMFGSLPKGQRPGFERPGTCSGTHIVHRPVNQCYLALARPWPSIRDKDYLAGLLLSTALGEGMSSRLFQLLREERGLAYDIESSVEAFPDTAALLVSATLERDKFETALNLILDEIDKMREDYLEEREIERAKRLLRAQLEMEWDSPSDRLWRAVETEIALGRYVSREEHLEEIDSLGADRFKALIEQRLSSNGGLLVVGGDVEKLEFSERMIGYCQNGGAHR